MKVFVIDESEEIREQLRVQLEELSNVYVVGEAWTGIQALPSIRTAMLDLIIMDYPIANDSSLALIASLKYISPSTALWVFTHSPSIEFQQACSKAGADCIDKSLGCDEVVRRVRDLVDSLGIPSV